MTKINSLNVFSILDKLLTVHKLKDIDVCHNNHRNIRSLNNIDLNDLIILCKQRIVDIKDVAKFSKNIILKNRYKILSYKWGKVITICRSQLKNRLKSDKLVKGRHDHLITHGFVQHQDNLKCCGNCKNFKYVANDTTFGDDYDYDCVVTDNDVNHLSYCKKFDRK
jgi:hypothetical protein